jgi:ABC-type branched-subunit amino acid transport system ATPase component
VIEIRDLSVSFGGIKALDSLTVTLADPIVGIIGPNGAGKTTLLNVFSGFVEPSAGAIRAFGADLLAMAPHRRSRWGLRRSFQTEQVVDDLTVADNVCVMLDALPGAVRRNASAQVMQALDFAGLAPRANVLAGTVNTFERRMLEIARTVIGSPRLVLLDEPAAGLHDDEVAVLREAILGIHRRCGATTLLIDHDVALIASTCVSTLVLDFGEQIACGPTTQVLRSERVKAAYLGIEEVAA